MESAAEGPPRWLNQVAISADDPELIAHYRFEGRRGDGDDALAVYDSGPNAYHGQMVDYAADDPAFTDQGKALCATAACGDV